MSEHTNTPWNREHKESTVIQIGTKLTGGIYGAIGSFDRTADAERAVDCVNACVGLNPQAIPKLVEACKKTIAKADEYQYFDEIADALEAVKETNNETT